jgi:hypothetical protein
MSSRSNATSATVSRLHTAKLLAEHGPGIKLPDLLQVIAQCPQWGSMDDGCRAQYAASSRMD